MGKNCFPHSWKECSAAAQRSSSRLSVNGPSERRSPVLYYRLPLYFKTEYDKLRKKTEKGTDQKCCNATKQLLCKSIKCIVSPSFLQKGTYIQFQFHHLQKTEKTRRRKCFILCKIILDKFISIPILYE